MSTSLRLQLKVSFMKLSRVVGRMSLHYASLPLAMLISIGHLSGQSIITAEEVARVGRDSLSNLFEIPARYGVSAYRVTYLTKGSDLLPDTASGLVVFPDEITDNGIIAYQHGTTSGPKDVPSLLNPEVIIPYAYASQGYIVSAADYLGLGVSRGFHPYLHAETEASAGIDLLLATINLAGQMGRDHIGHIFISGYSQGGQAAMAMTRAIQERATDDLWVTAAAPMSGPYDISGVMRDLVLLSEENYLFPAYLAYLILGYQEVYGNIYTNLEETFKAPFVEMIDQFHQEKIGLFELNDLLKTAMLLNLQSLVPRKILTDSYLDAIETDSIHPLNVALRENDTYQWAPEIPLRLFYCRADEQVSYLNSTQAASEMLSLGAPDVEAIDLLSSADHGECVLPAVLASLAFFNSFASPTVTKDILIKELQVYPNPASMSFYLPIRNGSIKQLTIFDSRGRVIDMDHQVDDSIVNVRHLPAGLYYLRGVDSQGYFNAKFVVQK